MAFHFDLGGSVPRISERTGRPKVHTVTQIVIVLPRDTFAMWRCGCPPPPSVCARLYPLADVLVSGTVIIPCLRRLRPLPLPPRLQSGVWKNWHFRFATSSTREQDEQGRTDPQGRGLLVCTDPALPLLPPGAPGCGRLANWPAIPIIPIYHKVF